LHSFISSLFLIIELARKTLIPQRTSIGWVISVGTVDDSMGLVIQIREREHTVLNADNSIARFDPRGRLIVRNESRRASIWDAELEPNSPNNSTLGTGAFKLGQLDPLEQWEKEFIIKDLEVPMLFVSEVVDACYERSGINKAFVFGQTMPVEFTITLRNRSGGTLTDIVVTKTIPPDFNEVEPLNIPIGKMEYNPISGKAVWTIKELEPERVVILLVRATMTAEDATPVRTGKLDVVYKVPNVSRSLLIPILRGVTDCEVNIEKTEDSIRRGIWQCNATLRNTSDFPIRIERIQVVMTAPTSKILFEGTLDHKLEPDELWSYEFETKEENPEFDIIALYQVEASLVQDLVGSVEKEEDSIPVARVECTKTVKPLELPAWESSPLSVSLEARNIGTSNLNEVTFFDTIPAVFDAPDKVQVQVWVDNKPITQQIDLTIRPKKRDEANARVVTIHVHDLMERQVEVKPGKQMTVKYTTIARSPKPEQEYILPLKVEANTYPPGPAANAALLALTAPKVVVEKAFRKLRKSRTVSPGPQTGEFTVTISFTNVSDSSLAGPKLWDLIPPSFEFVRVPDGIPEPIVSEAENGTIISWSLPTMKAGDRFQGKYIYRHKSQSAD
jgi:uncharacterized repeat protein (TIGR01451 family)